MKGGMQTVSGRDDDASAVSSSRCHKSLDNSATPV